MTDAIGIRPLVVEDRAGWDPLWAAYLRFYRQPNTPEVADGTFKRLTSRENGFFGVVATAQDGSIVGISHGVLHGTTWATTPSCYLNDLYVGPEARGRDVARMLIEATGEHASAAGSHVMYWNTQQFNGAARSLYDRVGHLTSYVRYTRSLTGLS